jgi:hypothetical protein
MKRGLFQEEEAANGTYLNELKIKNTLVSFSRRSEDLKLYNLVHDLIISYPSLNTLS